MRKVYNMDKPFLKLMSECYVNDTLNELNLKTDDVYEYITNAFDRFKEQYSDYIPELYEKPRSYQQDLVYIILDNKFNEFSYNEQSELDLLFNEDFQSISQIKNNLKKMLFKSNISPEDEFLSGIIEKNHDNCNRTCVPGNVALNSSQLTSLIKTEGDLSRTSNLQKIINLIYRRSDNTPEPKTVYKISKCLRLCYLDYMTSVYAEGVINYSKCNEELGPNRNNSINSYTDILNSYPMNDDCTHIFTYLNELFSDINKMLDIVYKNDSIRKRSWLNVIDEKMRAFRSGKKYVVDFSKIDDEYINPTDYVRTV